MKTRIISAAVALLLLFAVALSPTVVLQWALFVLLVVSLGEAYHAIGILKKSVLPVLGLYFAALTVVTMEQIVPFEPRVIALFSFGGLLLCFLTLVLRYGTVQFKDIAVTVLLSILLPLCFGSVMYVRQLPTGEYLFYYIFVGAFMPDTLAYFFGRAFGKRKLCPILSPKKTVAGSFGAVLGGIVGCLLLYGVLKLFFDYDALTLPMAIVFGVIAGIIAQIGDLTFSAIKRDGGIKDYGKIMPGHGGVLDRLDSVLFVAPSFAVFLWCTFDATL